MTELVERVTTDIESRLPGADARVRRSNLGVLARVVAGAAHGLYGYVGWVSKQVMPDSAESEHLERWSSIWGVGRTVATNASGTATIVGTSGITVPAGTLLQRTDGVEFVSTAAVDIAGGTAAIPVTAVQPGAEANTSAGTRLTLAAQILGVNATATVAAGGLVGGTDVESDDSVRERLLLRIRKPPQGGAGHDYEAWAREVPGVTRVWVEANWMGLGTVGVFFVRDGDADLIPGVPEVAEVQAYIEARRPVTAEVFVLAPTPLPVAVTLSVTPNTAAVKAEVEAQLADLFRREGAPGQPIPLSHFREAVSLAEGETDHSISVPAADVVPAAGEMPVLGVVTWA